MFKEWLLSENAKESRVHRAWIELAKKGQREVEAKVLANMIGITLQQLDRLNTELGGFYNNGWDDNTVSGHRVVAGDKLWNYVKEVITHGYQESILSEIFLHKSPGDIVIAFQKDIWLANYSDDATDILQTILDNHPHKSELENKLNYYSMDDVGELMNFLDNYVPDAITGYLHNKTLYINNLHANPTTNTLIKKVVETLKLKSVKIGEDETNYPKKKITGQWPDKLYHGTSTKYFDNIFKLGLMPNPENSNYDFVSHKDKVFVSANWTEAVYHAQHTAILTKALPMIVECKIPDWNRVLPDYDIDVNASRKTYNNMINQKAYYAVPSMRATKQAGVLAYQGRIPAKFITGFYLFNLKQQKWMKLKNPEKYYHDEELFHYYFGQHWED